MLADPAALDTVRHARRLARSRDDRLRLAVLEVWTRLRFSAPSDLAELNTAREIADSVLHTTPIDSVDDVRPLMSLAALTGRAALAAKLSRHRSALKWWSIPSIMGDIAPELLVFASFGGPVDSLDLFDTRFDVIKRTRLSGEDSARAIAISLQASMLAFPEYRFAVLREPVPPNAYYLRQIVAALVAGDTSTARRKLESLAQTRLLTQPADRAIESVYTEARVLEALGNRAAAASWLESTLEAIASADPILSADPIKAAPLIRAMALRAELAHSLGDERTARRWATPVTVFWADADPFLRPLVERMNTYVR